MHPIYKFNSMALQFTIFESKLANLCHTIFPIRNMKFIFLFNLADLCVDVVVAFHVNYCERCQTFVISVCGICETKAQRLWKHRGKDPENQDRA